MNGLHYKTLLFTLFGDSFKFWCNTSVGSSPRLWTAHAAGAECHLPYNKLDWYGYFIMYNISTKVLKGNI